MKSQFYDARQEKSKGAVLQTKPNSFSVLQIQVIIFLLKTTRLFEISQFRLLV
jgi:hypothetical protein